VRVRGAIDFPLAGVAVALRREGGGARRLAHRLHRCFLAAAGGSTASMRCFGKPLDTAALDAISEQADLANRSMKTTLVDVLYRRGVSLVLAKRLTQRLWDAVA
jgi:4-hydroxybenzoyl-CoA reductase subunit beta